MEQQVAQKHADTLALRSAGALCSHTINDVEEVEDEDNADVDP